MQSIYQINPEPLNQLHYCHDPVTAGEVPCEWWVMTDEVSHVFLPHWRHTHNGNQGRSGYGSKSTPKNLRDVYFVLSICVQCVPWSKLKDVSLLENEAKMNQTSSKMTVDLNQSELFLQLQMAAYYGGYYFQRIHPVNADQGSVIFAVALRCADERSPGLRDLTRRPLVAAPVLDLCMPRCNHCIPSPVPAGRDGSSETAWTGDKCDTDDNVSDTSAYNQLTTSPT